MLNREGVAYFIPNFLFERPWLQGDYFASGLAIPPNWAPANNVITLETLAGTVILQRLFTGVNAPNLQQPYSFDLQVRANALDDLEKLYACEALGDVVEFSAGFRVCDVFSFAEEGQSLLLSRPCGIGTISGIDDTYYETRIYVNEVLSDTAGTVTGQTFACAATGKVAVHYTPLHRVLVRPISNSLPNQNKLIINVHLDEVITAGGGDFG